MTAETGTAIVETYPFKTINEELNYLKDSNSGKLDPHHVVEYAKDPETLLHSKFEWDDSEAAEKFRLWQARQIIRLELIVIKPKKQGRRKVSIRVKPVKTRAYVSLTQDRRIGATKGYRSIQEVLSDKELRNEMVIEALKELLTFRDKYRPLNLTEFDGVFSEIDKLQEEFSEFI